MQPGCIAWLLLLACACRLTQAAGHQLQHQYILVRASFGRTGCTESALRGCKGQMMHQQLLRGPPIRVHRASTTLSSAQWRSCIENRAAVQLCSGLLSEGRPREELWCTRWCPSAACQSTGCLSAATQQNINTLETEMHALLWHARSRKPLVTVQIRCGTHGRTGCWAADLRRVLTARRLN